MIPYSIKFLNAKLKILFTGIYTDGKLKKSRRVVIPGSWKKWRKDLARNKQEYFEILVMLAWVFRIVNSHLIIYNLYIYYAIFLHQFDV